MWSRTGATTDDGRGDVDLELGFEEAASLVLEWMRAHGFPDADLMPDAGAGLFDVDASGAIAEITLEAPPSRPNIQRLDGVSREVGRQALFFSVRGFTGSAEEWADNVGIALFEFGKDGTEIIPVNGRAETLAKEPPSREEMLLAAAARAVQTVQEELRDEKVLNSADDDTRKRIEDAREAKRRRRDLLG